MYESFFGLTRRPFSESIPLDRLISLNSRDAALRRVRYGLEHGEGISLLHGPPGSGKTLLARQLGSEMDLPTIHLTFPALPTAELLAFLADELHAPGKDASLSGAVRRVRSALAVTAAKGLRTLLIVDEAHLIVEPETFETLRLLTNFATNGPPDLMLLLVGGTEILLNLPPSMLDRLASRALLGSFTEEESRQYLGGRLQMSGGSPDLFDPEAVEILHLAADGLPRRLNRLADLALLITYAEGLDRPDSRIIELATREGGLDSIAA